MIADSTLCEVVAILETEAHLDDVAAALASESHNRPYAEARLARAERLRGYAAEIRADLLHRATQPPSDHA